MSQYVASTLRRGQSGAGQFPVVEYTDLKLSDTIAVDLTGRDAIEEWRRTPYMSCYVISESKEYRLGSDVTIPGQVWTEIVHADPNALVHDDVFDSEGFVKPELLRNLFINDAFVVDDEAAMLAVSSVTGNVFVRTDTGGVFLKLNNDDPSDISDFAEITGNTGAVTSVNGMTGAVSVTIANLLSVTQNLTDFNAAVANNSLVLSHSASISSLTSNKADLVSGTVPLAQLPYIFDSGLTLSGSEVKLGGALLHDTTIDLSTFNFKFNRNSTGKFGWNLGSDQSYDIYYRDTDGYIQRLAIGSDGQVLKVSGGTLIYSNDLGGTSGGSVNWGAILGTITDQNDLISYLGTNYYSKTTADTRYLQLSGGTMTGNILFSGGAGLDSELTGGTDTLNIGTSNADVINIGWSGATINIQGNTYYQNVTQLQVKDKLFTLNKGGSVGSGASSGFEVEEGGSPTAYFATNATRDGWDFKAPSISSQLTLSLAGLTSSRTLSAPDTDGKIFVTGSTTQTSAGDTTLDSTGYQFRVTNTNGTVFTSVSNGIALQQGTNYLFVGVSSQTALSGSGSVSIEVNGTQQMFLDPNRVAIVSGSKLSTSPSSSRSGFNTGSLAGDVTSNLAAGDVWLNTSTGFFKGRISTTTYSFVMDTLAQTLTNKTISGASNTITNVSLSSGVTGRLSFANLTQGSAISVLGVTGSSTADNASIAGTANQVLRVNTGGTALAFGSIDISQSATVGTSRLAYANIAQGSALSVLGVTGNAPADVASMAAGTDGNILRRSGTTLAFGSIDLSASGAVGTTRLAYANITAPTTTSILFGRGSASTGDWQEITLGTGLSMSGTTLSASGAGVTPAALTKTDDTNVTLVLGGTPATALLQATSLTLGWTGTLAASRGGTANGFTAFSGPATSTKTFTLPNASATILTDNAAVTTAQGGTGFASYTIGDLLSASASTTLSKIAAVAAGSMLRSAGTSTLPAWSTNTWPNTTTSNQVLYATGTNAIGSSANFTFSGANLTISGAFLSGTGITNNTTNGATNGYNSTRTGTITANNIVAGYMSSGSFTMRASASDAVYLNQTTNTVTTGSTTQSLTAHSYTPTWTLNNTGAAVTGLIYNPTVNGTQVASTHYGLVIASGQAVIGATSPTNSASVILDLVSTTQGLGLPRLTTTQQNAVTTPFDGLLIHNTTLHTPSFYNGTAWTSLIGGSTGASDGLVLLSSGTVGATLKASVIGIDGSGNITGVGSLAYTGNQTRTSTAQHFKHISRGLNQLSGSTSGSMGDAVGTGEVSDGEAVIIEVVWVAKDDSSNTGAGGKFMSVWTKASGVLHKVYDYNYPTTDSDTGDTLTLSSADGGSDNITISIGTGTIGGNFSASGMANVFFRKP